MLKRSLIPLLVLASLAFAAPAQAKLIVGIGDQNPGTFRNPLWQQLNLKKVRYLVPWNTAEDVNSLREVQTFMATAEEADQEVLVHFTAVRGCFLNGKYSKTKLCRLPTVKQYTRAFKAFKKQFPRQKVYGTWNEVNHISQPTYSKKGTGKGPKRAAQYYKALKKNCKKCKVIAGDLLDSSNVRRYAKTMLKTTGRKARLWGLHNYSDVNRFRTKGTLQLLKTVPGEVWATETGGISIFVGSNLNPSFEKAAKAMGYVFRIASRYNKKRRGMKSRITRLYPYNFGPEAVGARFDAALVNPDGTPRQTYLEFLRLAKNHRR